MHVVFFFIIIFQFSLRRNCFNKELFQIKNSQNKYVLMHTSRLENQ